MIYNWLTGTLAALCIIIVTLACIGAALAFSPASQLDVWGGGYDALSRTGEGGFSAWWSQHHEHRILLSRVFFWLEYNVFGDSGIFLLVLNFLLAGIATGLFVWARLRSDPAGHNWRDVALFGLCIGAVLLLWTQRDTLTGLDQSAFLLAHVLPLAALLLLARSADHGRWSMLWFAAAVIAGLASIGTLATGLLVLPLLVLGAVLLQMSLVRIGVLVAVAGVGFWAFFHGYVMPESQTAITETLLRRPLDPVVYALRYLGSPVYRILGYSAIAAVLSGFAGFLLVAAMAIAALRLLRARSAPHFRLALLMFIGYVIVTAILTAIGRAGDGLEDAFSSRHTTSALMAWAALIVILMPALTRIKRNNPDFNSPFQTLAVAFFGALALYQFEAIVSRGGEENWLETATQITEASGPEARPDPNPERSLD